jgi:hypothetical protein
MTNDKPTSELKDQRVPVMMSASELKEIDDWRRRQDDLPSRSEAMRRLIALGIANDLHLKGHPRPRH